MAVLQISLPQDGIIWVTRGQCWIYRWRLGMYAEFISARTDSFKLTIDCLSPMRLCRLWELKMRGMNRLVMRNMGRKIFTSFVFDHILCKRLFLWIENWECGAQSWKRLPLLQLVDWNYLCCLLFQWEGIKNLADRKYCSLGYRYVILTRWISRSTFKLAKFNTNTFNMLCWLYAYVRGCNNCQLKWLFSGVW